MVPGFRYHVVTLVAIFMALGLGFMIGTSMPVRNALIERNTRAVDSLSNQFSREIQAQRIESQHHARFAAALVPWLVRDRMRGKHVAVIQTGDYPETASGIRETLESAGATVATVVFDPGFPTRITTNLTAVLPPLRESYPMIPANSAGAIEAVARFLARGGDQQLQPLESARLIRLEGDHSPACDFAVLVGGASVERESRAAGLDVPLISALQAIGVKVIAVQPQDAAISYLPEFRDLQVSTVDNADTQIGRLTVLLALQAERGSYGTGPSATSILPAPPASP